MRYLDPKHDLVFKKVFGHANLLQSFLNALLPLSSPIESLEYLPAELVPEIPVLKHSIVDVRCRDQNGRQFIVEMQMLWTDSFKSRVLFNASKAYVRQIDKTEDYESLEPVFSLNLVNQSFEKDTAEFYHHYAIVHLQDSGKRLQGLEFVFVELPKFRPEMVLDKPMADLWLRFLTEIESETETVPAALLDNPFTKEALAQVQESAFTKPELLAYDRYWDSIRMEVSLVSGARREGHQEGHQKGLNEGLQKGAQDLLLAKQAMALAMKAKGLPLADIAEITGLSASEVAKLLAEN
ncbi:MAG: Rpn family recombination-promoting nuclease/putative transposase [Verrucomicrobia bacterium]|nr:Rpn family recombination-promoting nuclease/putative transposase [Verrucomicrobiota bacterium]